MAVRWRKAMEAVHRVKLLLLLADFRGVKSAVPEIVARYKVFPHGCCIKQAASSATACLLV